MPQPPTTFEATNSWCYRFARYQAIPEILALPEVSSGEPFRLVDLSNRVINAHLSESQRETKYLRAKTNKEISISASVKFYIPFIAKNTKQLVRIGDGFFRVPTVDDVDEEAVEEEIEEAALDSGEGEIIEYDGWIYAFTFPLLIRSDARFPIKVGKTGGDVDVRVIQQCRSSATFDTPVILGRWNVKRVHSVEMAIHYVLKARGQWREQAFGSEWFDAQIHEIETIIDFVTRR